MMEEGVFAFLDCLGWKGIWQRMPEEDPRPLIAKLEKIERRIQDQIENREGIFAFLSVIPAKVKISFLSDTVTISLIPQIKELPDRDKGLFISMMSTIVGDVVDFFIEDTPPLTLRGCINYGKHVSKGNFIIGPAVDDAAASEKLAEGAFVWLVPEILPYYEAFLNEYTEKAVESGYTSIQKGNFDEKTYKKRLAFCTKFYFSSLFISLDYSLPIKSNKTLQCAVLNPLLKFDKESRRQEIITEYLSTMQEEREDIVRKRENTSEMLKTANEYSGSFYKMMNETQFSMSLKSQR